MEILAQNLDIALFGALCLAILAGFPVAFTLAGASLLMALVGGQFGVFNLGLLGAFPQRIYGIMTNPVLVAVPLFIFMGVMLERSRVAERLLDSMAALFGPMHGGLGIAVTIVGALMAASTGIVGATVVTMGLLALPTMLRRGYDPALAAGTISAAGTLGQIIPPSIVLILLAEVLGSSYQRAQTEQGIFAPDTLSVGDLFAGALIPGLILVGLYILWQLANAWLRPGTCPPVDPRDLGIPRDRSATRHLLGSLIPPLVLVVAVLGSILAGIATPTEAASVGAVGALMLAVPILDGGRRRLLHAGWASLVGLLLLATMADLRLRRSVIELTDVAAIALALTLCLVLFAVLVDCLRRTARSGVLQAVVQRTTQLTAMVFLILIGAALFAIVFRGLGGDDTVRDLLAAAPGGLAGAVALVMVVIFVLGFFLDFIEITLVVVPIVAPALMIMGADPVWLGILIAVNLQTSFLTPPFGFALFYLRGVAPPNLSTLAIYRGIVPFIVIQIIMLGIIAVFPQVALWLPERLGR